MTRLRTLALSAALLSTACASTGEGRAALRVGDSIMRLVCAAESTLFPIVDKAAEIARGASAPDGGLDDAR